MTLQFVKGHGTQNDFVLLPDPEGSLELTPEFVRAVCDRRAGLGADGVLRVAPSGDGDARWFMDHRNADGTPAEMCGNGLRLFARFLVQSGRAELGEQRIGTRSGVRRAVVSPDGTVCVEMGAAALAGTSVAGLGGQEYAGTVVSMGNPHLVCVTTTQVSDLDLSAAPSVDPAVFAAGVNVEFVNVLDSDADTDAHVRMRVYERGVGETSACGTGACAVAAVTLGGSAGRVVVGQPGGRVVVTIDGQGCWLSGPTVIVGSGELDRTWLSPLD